MGLPTLKCPLDLWVYQEILCDIRPQLVIETGTAFGGSALFLASVMDSLGEGRVLTIDTLERDQKAHPRIRYLLGSSIAPTTLAEVTKEAQGASDVLVVLDSAHEADHVLAELRAYSPFVTPGSFLIVEDTNLNGWPVERVFGPGPHEAVTEFLEENDDFVRDRSTEKFLLTFNPGGYLRRLAADR
jgi:cephalosporin hydroxylase